jgi:3-oxoacyl-[acyl-carrier-protein] synthase III
VTAASRNTVIESLGHYLPSKVVSTRDVLRGCRNKVLFPLEGMTGIHHRRIAADDEFSIDLARKAIADCLRRSRHAPAAIDLLVCCNISRYDGAGFSFSYEPNTAVKLRAEFGFDNALAFDITNACAGVFTGLVLADAFLKAGAARRAMLVSGEYITHLTRTAQHEIDSFMDSRLACLTLGDAGIALVVEPGGNGATGFHDIDLYTLGRYSSYCVARVTDPPNTGAIMFTDGVRTTSLAIQQSVVHSAHVLQRAGWEPDSFQHLIMHQTSEMALNSAAKAINTRFGRKVCHDGNIVLNLADRGNTATTSHFLALAETMASGRVKSGDRVVFAISASGVTMGTALYTLDDLPDRMRSGAPTTGRSDAGTDPDVAVGAGAALPRVRIESVGSVSLADGLPRSAVKLATAAAERCLAASAHGREAVGLLIHAGVYREGFICEPAIAAFVAGELAMNDDVTSIDQPKTLAFDVFNGGVGFLNACCVAARIIQTRGVERAMIVTAEIENNADIAGAPRRGVAEMGSAVMLERGDASGCGFGEFLFRYVPASLEDFTATTAIHEGMTRLIMTGSPQQDAVWLEAIPDAVAQLLERADLPPEAIDVVLPPQLSPSFVRALQARLALPQAAWVNVAGDAGDLFTSSLPAGFAEARRQGLARPGTRGLIINVAAGAQIGCAIYYF